MHLSDSQTYRSSVILFLGLSLAVVVAAFFTLRNLAAQQSHEQQQSISPVFSLIEQELIAPLEIAKTLASAGVYDAHFSRTQPQADDVINQLKFYQQQFGLTFYLAHEQSRVQYNSDGSQFPLEPGKVWWYFELKDDPNDVLAVLGKQEDIHLYVDVKQYDGAGNFAGFAGVGKSLKEFIQVFSRYRQQFGHEFIFANHNDQIVLSSRQELLPENFDFKKVSDLPWYASYTDQQRSSAERAHLISSAKGDMLISSFHLDSLDWQLYVLTPLASRQETVNRTFLLYLLLAGVLLLVAYKLIKHLLAFYYQRVSRRFNVDPLTRVANRLHLESEFQQMRESHLRLGLIVVDIDNFKAINDTFGHNAGDKALVAVAECLSAQIAEQDCLARWGGEEFVIVTADKTPEQLHQLAEQCRTALASMPTPLTDKNWIITGSFGIASSVDKRDSLSQMFDAADHAMYQAKKAGKNTICCANIDN